MPQEATGLPQAGRFCRSEMSLWRPGPRTQLHRRTSSRIRSTGARNRASPVRMRVSIRRSTITLDDSPAVTPLSQNVTGPEGGRNGASGLNGSYGVELDAPLARSAAMTSSWSGNRPVSCFENTVVPSATTSKTPLFPSISSGSIPNVPFTVAAKLVALGPYFQRTQ